MRDSIRTIVLITLAACGPGDRDPGNGGPDGGNPPGGDGNNNTEDCSEEAKLIYTVDSNNTLSRFDPVTKQFQDLGALSCAASLGATPFSMGVDRDANAWVLYSSGELFNVNTETLDCVKTAWAAPSGIRQFGMGFSTETAGGTIDTLFIAGSPAIGQTTTSLQKLDTATLTTQPVGTVTGSPELTGTGNAELWGFFPTNPGGGGTPRIEQISKTDGSGLRTFMLSSLAGEPAAWAFAFFGGDFYVFLERNLTDPATIVYQVDGTNGTVKGMTPTNTRTIVGAGVSTCAPVILL
jgi:hypothetical protein